MTRRPIEEWEWDFGYAETWEGSEDIERYSRCEGRSEDEEWDEELWLLNSMQFEQEYGARWLCPGCNMEYYVKTPFHSLYCSDCLCKLQCFRIVPVSMTKEKVERHKCWTMEDYRH